MTVPLATGSAKKRDDVRNTQSENRIFAGLGVSFLNWLTPLGDPNYEGIIQRFAKGQPKRSVGCPAEAALFAAGVYLSNLL
ncbi:hypothetical protein AYJ00_13405 [Shewanella algae]|nr:hypothetical protein AYJ00_13405 [Shewanella algae]